MSDKYILDGHNVVECSDLMKWAEWFETAHRHVAKTDIGVPAWKHWLGKHWGIKRFEPVRISTIFLGLDHRFGSGPPLLFETMIFGGKFDQEQWRYSTWDEAERCHRNAVEKIGKL